MAEVNEKEVQNTIGEEFEDFESMLEESLEKTSGGGVTKGIVVAIKGEDIFVDVDRKTEGVLKAYEVTDKDGNITVKPGDEIEVIITGNRGGKPLVSFEKAKRIKKVAEFIENFNENNEVDVEVKIVSKNRGGYICVSKDGVEFFMPRSQSALRDSNSLIGKTYKARVFKIDKENSAILVSRKKIIDEERKAKKEVLDQISQTTDIIEGVVKKITTYGMFVDVGGVDGLVHYSEISYKGPVNPSTLFKEGDKVPVKVLSYDKEKKHLSLSIKEAMPDPWLELAESGLAMGDVIKVVVNNIEPYGAFVDLGNDIEGFLHISEISWDKNIQNPKDFINEGDEIDVEVIEIDTEKRKLRVSLKNLLEKPFDEFKKNYKVGDVVKGSVVTITKFGAFIKIGTVEGLLRNEDVSWDRNETCKDLLKVGDEIEVKITSIDTKEDKVSLSRKDLEDSPIAKYAASHKVGDIVKGTIRNIKDFGLFVELEEGVDALLRKEDISNIEDLKVGDEIESAIDYLDTKRNRIRLSVKRLSRQKERAVLNEINSENDDNVTIGDLIKEQLHN
ncbi:30S ribosomal protein S1 [Campylobacter ureolyticus]|uniref:30S ribosomal protein S1 n=1 Tax=Campylobacter ureolyticus TaxID=827 RepID=A0A9Q4KM51_9BACT|nr:30S ribosomal protein S1 [Campylobacter ureolyticus]MCZ6111138.1 30S ribosomal protein S1 [Campylobacter ureolyticus]MCZ6160116.1 30S ribosomal protein S1 [Campylobacter ureolyticus]MCZ6163967.1 30S ribosomal protein S1 [Campylobacter ureolyticus]MCZ6165936.1 30S ribosomal protein S1 [Campylobacter ureolyticus]MCZ6167374.1 30S ribosomal protein S1 [Campylobacter ureolyticus]